MMMTSLSFSETHELIVHFILMKLLFPNIDIFSPELFQLLFLFDGDLDGDGHDGAGGVGRGVPRFCVEDWQRMTSCLEPRHTIRGAAETETNLVCRKKIWNGG